MRSVGRNDPCPCGSGKKFKRCHGGPTARSPAVLPEMIPAMLQQGDALRRAERYSEAEGVYRSMLQISPSHSVALENLGILAVQRNSPEDAIALLTRAGALAPERASAHYNLGAAYIAAFRFAAAKDCFLRAIELDPEFAAAYNNLGNIHRYLGDPVSAIRYYARALELAPHDAALHSNYIISLHLDETFTAHDLFAQHQAWAMHHAQKHYPTHKRFANAVDPERRLNLGFVSPNFNGNIVGQFLRPAFSTLDREQFLIHCYSNTKHMDALNDELRAHAFSWNDIRALDDAQAAHKIESDGIDILIDLAGHTPNNRLLIFARKPAPIQVAWLDYFDTTGLATMDYIVSDPITTPPGSPQRFVEKVLHLPTRLCWSPPHFSPEVVPRSVTKRIVFGSFNRLDKINVNTIKLWAAIIRATDASLLLKSRAFSVPELCENLLTQFAAHGVAATQIELRGPCPYPQLLSEYGDIDIALDTYPYNGGATSADALWMGVPVITLAGERMISRQTAAMLHRVGLDSFVAENPARYLEIAVRSAKERDRLAEIRAGLRAAVQTSALGNASFFTQSFADCLRTIWRRWCAGIQR
jgi:predicted O-linked N-acetylglucosamine transferase (SPINDLY family)